AELADVALAVEGNVAGTHRELRVRAGAVEGTLQVGGHLALHLAVADVHLHAEELRAALARRSVALLDAAAGPLLAAGLRGTGGGRGQGGAGGGEDPAHEGAAVYAGGRGGA